MATFIELARAGEVPLAAIDDFIDAWHDGEGDCSLHEWLGFTWDEYTRWARDSGTIVDIVRGGSALQAAE